MQSDFSLAWIPIASRFHPESNNKIQTSLHFLFIPIALQRTTPLEQKQGIGKIHLLLNLTHLDFGMCARLREFTRRIHRGKVLGSALKNTSPSKTPTASCEGAPISSYLRLFASLGTWPRPSARQI